jgi:protein SCO1/2
VKKVLILFAILVVPSIYYLVVRAGKNNYKPLEYFGPKEPVLKTVNGKSVVDTVYHSVGGFSLLDQDSNSVTEKVVDGKIYVADFIFTSCKTICPKMSNQMMAVQYKFKDSTNFNILSFTVDPEFDSPSVLKTYAQAHQAIKNKWYFLTGDKKMIYDLARNSYFVTALKGDGGPDDFVHSEQVVLVDKEKHIRGFYDGTDVMETRRLNEDISTLMFEYAHK